MCFERLRPAAQSAGCWSLSAGLWWRPAPPAVCPGPPSEWRSAPQLFQSPAPPSSPPAAAETPARRRDARAAKYISVAPLKLRQHFMLSEVESPSKCIQ